MQNFVLQQFRGKAALAWFVLVAATVISWWVGTDHDLLGGAQAGTVTVLVIAFAKIWVVTTVFMESRSTTRVLGTIIDTWTVASCALVVGLYLAL